MLYALIIGDLLMAAVFLLNMNHLPPQLPIFYSRQFGEDQLGEVWYLFLLPGLIHLLLFLNIYLYNRFFLPDQFIKKILNVVNWFIIVVLSFMFGRIILFIS